MTTRTRILVVDSDLDNLSKIYLGLIHRNYKAEASDNTEEIPERIKRMKPAVIIVGKKEYLFPLGKSRIPVILLVDKAETVCLKGEPDLILLEKPVSMDTLVHTIESLVV